MMLWLMLKMVEQKEKLLSRSDNNLLLEGEHSIAEIDYQLGFSRKDGFARKPAILFTLVQERSWCESEGNL